MQQCCMHTFVCVILPSILYTVYIQQCCMQHTVHYYVNFFEENIRNYSMGHTRMLPRVHFRTSVNATSPRPPQHALTGLGAANCHTPGKYHITLCRTQGERSVVTTMQASTLEYHRICSLHNSLDCHVHPNHITVVFIIH